MFCADGADPSCLDERSPDGGGALHALCDDLERAEPILAELLAHGADPSQEDDAGRTAAQRLEERGADEVADLLEVMRGEEPGAGG